MEEIGKILRIVNEAVIYGSIDVEDADLIENLLKRIELRITGVTYNEQFYRNLLTKYMEHVEECESITYVSKLNSNESYVKFNENEISILKNIDKKIDEKYN